MAYTVNVALMEQERLQNRLLLKQQELAALEAKLSTAESGDETAPQAKKDPEVSELQGSIKELLQFERVLTEKAELQPTEQAELREKYLTAMEKLKYASNLLDTKSTRIVLLNKNLELANGEVAKRNDEMFQMMKNSNEKKEEIKNLKRQIETQQEELQLSKERLHETMEKYRTAQAIADKVSSQAKANNAELKRNRELLRTATTKSDMFEGQVENQQQELLRLQRLLAGKKTRSSRSSEREREHREKLEALAMELIAKDLELGTLKEVIEGHEMTRANLVEQIKEMTEKVKQVDTVITIKEGKNEQLIQAVKSLKTAYENVRCEADAAIGERTALLKTNANNDSERKILIERVKNLTGELRIKQEHINTTQQAFDKKMKELISNNEILEGHNKIVSRDFARLRKESENKTQQLQDLNMKLRQARERHEGIAKKLEEHIKRLDSEKKPKGKKTKKSSSKKLNDGEDNVATLERIQDLERNVEMYKEASNAHQSHNVFLTTELGRVEDEKRMELEIKENTIKRLQSELEGSGRNYNLGNEDIQSQLEFLLKEYFFSVALNIKMSEAEAGKFSNINLHELYDQAPKPKGNVTETIRLWPEWIRKKMASK